MPMGAVVELQFSLQRRLWGAPAAVAAEDRRAGLIGQPWGIGEWESERYEDEFPNIRRQERERER